MSLVGAETLNPRHKKTENIAKKQIPLFSVDRCLHWSYFFNHNKNEKRKADISVFFFFSGSFSFILINDNKKERGKKM